MQYFSSVVAPVTNCIEKGPFVWTKEANESFRLIRQKLIEAPVLALLDLDEVFQLDCDAVHIGIGAVLTI